MAILDGNVYVNPAYTSQEAIDALGGTSSITGEVLEFGVNAFASGGTTSNVPAEGGTIFFQDVDRFTSSIYNDGTYDGVFLNTRSNYLYALPKVAGTADKSLNYTRDIIKIYVDGGTHQHITLLGRSNYVNLYGDLSFTAKNADLGQDNQNMGGGDSTDNSHCSIIGDVSFDISNCQSGGSFYVHYGSIGTAEEKVKITGKVVNFTLNRTDNNSPTFRGVRTGDNYGVWADYDLTVSSSWFKGSLEMGYATDNSTWEGNFVMNVSATTAANIYAFERATMEGLKGDHKFTLNILASEATTQAAVIGNFNEINIAAGATLTATASVNDAADLNIAIGGLIVTPALSGIGCINVTGEFVQADTVIISGLTSSSIDSLIMYGDQEITQGKFGGQYEILAGNLVIHNPSNVTVLVNSNYTNGQTTDLGVKGYSTLAAAQTAVTDKAKTTIMVTTLDTDVDPSDFTADLVTKDYLTVLDGANDALDLQGMNLIIGDTAADIENASVSVSNTTNINTIAFGNVTGTASVGIVDSDEIGTIDLTGAAITDAQISVEGSEIGDVILADNSATGGKITIKDSDIENVYGGAANLTADLTGKNTIENVYAEGQGSKIKLAGSHIGTYMAGSNTEGTEFETLTFNDGFDADKLIIGGNENIIDKIDATITGGEVNELIVGGEDDSIGDVDLTISGGKFSSVTIGEEAEITGAINVTLAGGTTAQRDNGVFYGLIYGASVTGTLDGNGGVLTVLGNAKVNAVENFGGLFVTGGTLNVAGGTDKSAVSTGNTLAINGDILNRRGINAGVITATGNLINYGVVGTIRDGENADVVAINLTGDLENYDYVMTAGMNVDGSLTNTGKITATGDITVGGAFSNSGELYFKAVSTQDGQFIQDGGLFLGGVDVVNTGFISAGSLSGVKNLTTSKLYVTGGAEITGNITIDAGAEVAFTNKADSSVENGLTLGGSIYMGDTSRLVVSGNLSTTGTKTITVNVGDLEGVQEIVRAEGGVNDWTIKLAGDNAGLYTYTKDDYSVTIYSVDELYVNSKFSADQKIVINGETLVYGVNAFSSVDRHHRRQDRHGRLRRRLRRRDRRLRRRHRSGEDHLHRRRQHDRHDRFRHVSDH